MTHARAAVWGNQHTQALIWAQINPHSPRAQANAAQIEMQPGDRSTQCTGWSHCSPPSLIKYNLPST